MKTQKLNQEKPAGADQLIQRTDEAAEQFNVSFGEYLAIAVTWLQKLSTHLENQNQHQLDVDKQLLRIEKQLERQDTEFDGLRKQQNRLTSILLGLSKESDTQGHNIEQIRLLNDGLVRKVEDLSQEFIQEHVEAPLYKEYAKIYGSILTLEPLMKASGQDDLISLANSIERFLDSEGIKIIRPKPGDQFEPRQHQPIKKSNTDQSSMSGRIAKTYLPGLGQNGRIIQHARVAVFTFKEKSQTQE